MPFETIPPMNAEALMTQAFAIANRAIVADVESECDRVVIGGVTWYDTLPMLSEQEHSTEVLDMVTECLSYGLASGLLVRHHNLPQLVRIAQGRVLSIEEGSH